MKKGSDLSPRRCRDEKVWVLYDIDSWRGEGGEGR